MIAGIAIRYVYLAGLPYFQGSSYNDQQETRLMNKAEALNMLHAARAAHVQWRARAQALAAGLPVEKEQVPVLHTDCKFGKWYYGPGQALSFLESFRAVEEPHEQLHAIYMRMFGALFGETNKSVFSKLFGSQRKQDAKRLAEAQEEVKHLVAISRTLLEAIEWLEKDLKGLTDEELAAENFETGRVTGRLGAIRGGS